MFLHGLGRFSVAGKVLGAVAGPSCSADRTGPAGVRVVLSPAAHDDITENTISTFTSEGGSYTFENLPIGTVGILLNVALFCLQGSLTDTKKELHIAAGIKRLIYSFKMALEYLICAPGEASHLVIKLIVGMSREVSVNGKSSYA